MKTSLILLSLAFLAFSTVPTTSGQGSPDVVHDIDGNPLRTGTSYYVLPVIRGRGGGLGLRATRNTSCPLDVVQEYTEVNRGLPVKFTPVNPKQPVVRESTDLNVEFSASSTCVQSTVWMLEGYNGERIVTTGGVKGNPGRETVNNWFRIEKYQNDYKFVFCPAVCDTCRPVCGDLGISVAKNGSWRLAIRDGPLMVMFKKA